MAQRAHHQGVTDPSEEPAKGISAPVEEGLPWPGKGPLSVPWKASKDGEGVPVEAGRGGAETMYPEFVE